jgi:hypothetical protein
MLDDPRPPHHGKVWKNRWKGAGSYERRKGQTLNLRFGYYAGSKGRYSSGGLDLQDVSLTQGKKNTSLGACPSFQFCGVKAFWVTGFQYSEGANSVGS